MPEPVQDRRRTFGPVLAAGVASSGLAAVSSARSWFAPTDSGSSAARMLPGAGPVAEMPLAAALSLVVLAGWGAVLVTRGRVRRAVSVLVVVAAVGLCLTVVTGWSTLPDQVAEAYVALSRTDTVSTQATPWFWCAALTAVVAVVTGALAVAWCPSWPEMGSRYDAPGNRGPGGPADLPPEQQTHLDLWKQLDEGRDPTA